MKAILLMSASGEQPLSPRDCVTALDTSQRGHTVGEIN